MKKNRLPKLGAKGTVPSELQSDVHVGSVEQVAADSRDSMSLESLGAMLSGTDGPSDTDDNAGQSDAELLAELGMSQDFEEDEGEGEIHLTFAPDMLERIENAVETTCIVLVVVQRRTRFLCVQETDEQWYVPAGRVYAGETFRSAALRETYEEAHVNIDIDGILRIEQSLSHGSRVRIVYKASPMDPTVIPKQEADEESLQSRWLSTAVLKKFRLRSQRVVELFNWSLLGAKVYNNIVESPEFGPERSQISLEKHDTLLVHSMYLCLLDRRRRLYLTDCMELPEAVLTEGKGFRSLGLELRDRIVRQLGVKIGSHELQIAHIWHAPPCPLDGVGRLCFTLVQKIRGDLPASADYCVTQTRALVKIKPWLKGTIATLLRRGKVQGALPYSLFVAEDAPFFVSKKK